MANMIILTFFYLGFALKIYVLSEEIPFLYMAPVSIGPVIVMYGVEMIREVSKDSHNWAAKRAHVAT